MSVSGGIISWAESLLVAAETKRALITAALGGEALVQTLYGKVSCKIKEGTQSGTKIRLKGKGIVSMKNPSQKGDEYAVIQIRVPKHLSPDAKQKLSEYAKAAS
mgnify:CR=1 FL=1